MQGPVPGAVWVNVGCEGTDLISYLPLQTSVIPAHKNGIWMGRSPLLPALPFYGCVTHAAA